MSKNSGALPRPEAQAGSIEFYSDGVDVARAASGSIKSRAKMVVVETTSEGATSVGKSIINLSSATTVGLDLAKHIFQVHCVDALGRVVAAKPIRRNKLLEFFASLPRCLVGLEASGSIQRVAEVRLANGLRSLPDGR
jgi:hypothetical protein